MRRFTRFLAMMKLFQNPERASHQPDSQPDDRTEPTEDLTRYFETDARRHFDNEKRRERGKRRLDNDYWGNWQFWDGSTGLLDFGWEYIFGARNAP